MLHLSHTQSTSTTTSGAILDSTGRRQHATSSNNAPNANTSVAVVAFPALVSSERKVRESPHHTGRVRVRPMFIQPRQLEIPQPAVHLAVKKDIARLHVPVDDHLLPSLVEIEQPRSNPFNDLKLFIPA
ncbi:hypothetical protein AAC387_Pa07g3809 [Persea americana]